MEDIDIRKTGKEVDKFVQGLIESADDKNAEVSKAISDALHHIGKCHVNLVLSSCLNYLVSNLKTLTQGHRVTILTIMERIVVDMIEGIEENIAQALVSQAASEMILSKDVVPQWQTAASNLLVAAGSKYVNKVMGEITLHFQPGVLPHFFVVQTMGKLAVANAYGMVPFINVVLGTMLPMLGMAKHENLRWVFSFTLSKFAEAIVYYVENIDQAPDKNVRVEVFSNEFFSAYDVLFNVWLPQAKDSKLKISVIRALGQISYIISKDQLTEQLPKLVPSIIAQYQKQAPRDQLATTESLCMVLDSATQNECQSLDGLLETIINQLHTFICQSIDSTADSAELIKNQNEILRCFAMLNRKYSDRLVAVLLQRLEMKEKERVRIGSLVIIRHLVNSAGPQMEAKKALVISGLRILTKEPSTKVRKVFAQTIIAMAHHGYLEMEGGDLMVEFIVRQCTLADAPHPTKKPVDADYVSPQALRAMCESVLQLVVTTIDIMEKVLWPFLLEFITPVEYTAAFGVICKSLGALGAKKRHDDDADYLIDFEDEANIPAAEAIVARLFVMAGIPENGMQRGVHVLTAMSALVPNLHQDLVTLWDDLIPKLITKLEGFEDEDAFPQKKWDDLILRLLSKSFECVEEEKWITDVGQAFGDQISLYKDYPEEKNFCFKCLGVVMRKATQKEFIQSHMDLLFQKVNHSNLVEQEGVAIGLGFTAATHFDTVLTKLELVIKSDTGKKSSGIIGFLRDKVHTPSDSTDGSLVKQTVMLSYGYVTLFAPVTLVTSRIEAVVLRNITPYFNNQKDNVMKMNLINTIELIAKSLDPVHLQKQHVFTQRTQLITYLMNCMKNESAERLTGKIRSAALGACSALVKLEPALPEADLLEMMTICSQSILALPADGVKKGKSDTFEEQLAQQQLMSSTLAAFNNLLHDILDKELSAQGLHSIIKHLVQWLASERDNERERAVSVLHSLVKYYLENIQSANKSTGFTVLGEVVGRLVPRCTDPTITVRDEAILAIQACLRIQLVYSGSEPATADKMIDALPILQERLQKSDPTILFTAVNDLSKVIAKKLPAGPELSSVIDVLMEGLADKQALCSNAACVVLNAMAKLRGAELEHMVPEFLRKLHSHLPQIGIEQTRVGALRCVKSLAGHHLESVQRSLLTYPLPYDTYVVEFWQVLAKEAALTDRVLAAFLDSLKQNMPYEEKVSPADRKKSNKVAMPIPLAIVVALDHMLEVPAAKDIVVKHFADIFAALLVKVGCYSNSLAPTDPSLEPKSAGKSPGKSADQKNKSKQKSKSVALSATINPSRVISTAMKKFFELMESTDILQSANETNTWEKLESSEEYVSGIEHLALALAKHNPGQLAAVVESLRSSLSNMYDMDRTVVTAFYGQLIQCKCGGDLTLVEVLVGYLMGRLVDSCIAVRMLCVRGLGNIADTGTEMVQKYSTTVLSAMMSGMDDRDDDEDIVTIEAMRGLSKILVSINESHIRPILINIALKIRPCFERDNAAVRTSAFRLFGNLSKFGSGPSASPFLEQITSNLTAMLLHLNDRDDDVKLACKHALKLIGPLLNSTALNEMFQKYLIDSAKLYYGEFINDVCKIMVVDFKDKVPHFVMNNITYFKSQWAEIKANAALYLGFLVSALPNSSHNQISQDQISSALLTLLRDSDSDVRCKAAEAMSLLYNM